MSISLKPRIHLRLFKLKTKKRKSYSKVIEFLLEHYKKTKGKKGGEY